MVLFTLNIIIHQHNGTLGIKGRFVFAVIDCEYHRRNDLSVILQSQSLRVYSQRAPAVALLFTLAFGTLRLMVLFTVIPNVSRYVLNPFPVSAFCTGFNRDRCRSV